MNYLKKSLFLKLFAIPFLLFPITCGNCTNSQETDSIITLNPGFTTISIADIIIKNIPKEQQGKNNSQKIHKKKAKTDIKNNSDKKNETAKISSKIKDSKENSVIKTQEKSNGKTIRTADQIQKADKKQLNKKKHKEAIRQISVKMIPVDIYVPENENIIGDILVLPGWRYSRKRWYKETDLLKYAEKYGFRAVFPEMGITNYESKYFKKTTLKWAATPGGKWIKEIFIPHLQKKYGLFLSRKRNYILGLSTGGRGVLLISLQNPDLFKAGATLSGDCNQVKMPMDRLMTKSYGPFKSNRARWHNVDNPERKALAGKWKMPLYIGHGKKDRISPFSQSASLYRTLKKMNPKLKVKFNAPKNAGHDFKYWNSEVGPALKFFLEVQ